MRKTLIILFCSLFVFGCGGSNEKENPAKNEPATNSSVEISIKENKWNMDLPKSWEKLKSFPEKGVIFLAREGSQNIVITSEKGFSDNIVDRLSEGLQKNLSMVEEVSKTTDYLIFRGKLSPTAPMREFYQKAVPIPETDDFLLFSCSQEVKNLAKLECPEILDSFYLIELE